jgi:hypothetical protein
MIEMAAPQQQDKFLAEFPPIGKYKVRLIEGTRGKVLDIRELTQIAQLTLTEGAA